MTLRRSQLRTVLGRRLAYEADADDVGIGAWCPIFVSLDDEGGDGGRHLRYVATLGNPVRYFYEEQVPLAGSRRATLEIFAAQREAESR